MNPSADQPLNPEQYANLKNLHRSIWMRKGHIGCGNGFSVALHSCGRILYAGSNRCGQADALAFIGISTVSCSDESVVALMKDGTVRTAGRDASEQDFADTLFGVRSLACGPHHMAALMGDGHVLISCEPPADREARAEWPVMMDVVCGPHYTAALTDDGHVYISGGSYRMRRRVGTWKHIAGIFADGETDTLYAIADHGQILSTGWLPRRVRLWNGLVYVAASGSRICAVTATGELLSTHPIPADFKHQKTYIACAVGRTHMMALTRNGIVEAGGQDEFGQCKTARFGKLFGYFDDVCAARSGMCQALDASERLYQKRRTDTERFVGRLVCNSRLTACITANGRVLTSTGYAAGKTWAHVRTLSCGNAHLLALHRNGRVSAGGNNVDGCCDVADWSDIRSVAAGNYHSLAVTMNGRVLFCGLNDKGQGNVSDWTGIRSLAVADAYTVGITYGGQMLVTGHPPFEPHLIAEFPPHPVSVVATDTHLVCLYADGHVAATAPSDGSGLSQTMDPATAAWCRISAVAAGPGFTVGLCYHGTVLAAGNDTAGCCRVSDWKQVVAIGCGKCYTAGLTADGHMLVAGTAENDHPLRVGTPLSDATRWENIIAFACGSRHLVAVNHEGQVLACGSDAASQCSATAHFTLFQNANFIYQYVKCHDDRCDRCDRDEKKEESAASS